MSHTVVPKKTYYLVFAALLVLTIATVLVARVDWGTMNDVIAMGIAITKATLVILFFMHVKYSPRLTQLVVAGSCLWLIILLGLTLTDYLSRAWL